ncbi:hypothetical protein GC173_07020 [bacterium]|nr:hypothetical protein [bacterium]
MTTTSTSWKLYPASEAGHTAIGWLDSRHTFSFGEFLDPARMGFRSLRVINDDIVAPGEGFGMHGHRDMEILSFVAQGALEHKDSMGNGATIRPGEIQFMGAGTGVRHSEFNPSQSEDVRLLQIWIVPAQRGLPPTYSEATYGTEVKPGTARLLASGEDADGLVKIRQDARLYVADVAPGSPVKLEIAAGRGGFVQVVDGDITVGGLALGRGDAAALDATEATVAELTGSGRALVFDLA